MGVNVGSKLHKEQETWKCFSSSALCFSGLCCHYPLCLDVFFRWYLICKPVFPPQTKKVIPKENFGWDEHLSGRTCHWPCSFLGSWLSSAPCTCSNSPDEIKAAKCFPPFHGPFFVSVLWGLTQTNFVFVEVPSYLVVSVSPELCTSAVPDTSGQLLVSQTPSLSFRRSRSQTWVSVPPQFLINIPHQNRGEENIVNFSTFWFLLLLTSILMVFFIPTERSCPLGVQKCLLILCFVCTSFGLFKSFFFHLTDAIHRLFGSVIFLPHVHFFPFLT